LVLALMLVAAVVVVVEVVVVRGGELAFGARTFSTYHAQH